MSNGQPDPNTTADRARLGGDVSSTGRLENLARQLAESHTVTRCPRRSPVLLERLREQEALLRDAYQHFVEASEAQLALAYAVEWLLDNFYVVQQALRQVRKDMPKGYCRWLPKLDTPPLRGFPRIYALAREMIEYCGGRLDMEWMPRFVQAYQRLTPLTMGELWALPTMLRLGILELLTQTVARVMGMQAYGENSPLTVSLPDEQRPEPDEGPVEGRRVHREP